MQINIC